MSPVPDNEAAEIGDRLRRAGFRPLPDIARGQLLGTQMWRVRNGIVELAKLRKDGTGYAARLEAVFNWRRPIDHGPIIEDRFGYVATAVGWLLEPPVELESPPNALRPYVDPDFQSPTRPRGPDDLDSSR